MTAFAPITAAIDDRGFGESRFGNTINGFVVHICGSRSCLAFVSRDNDRNNHPTYHIDKWGKVTGLVPPRKRPTTTAHSIDQEAVTVEIDNSDVGHPWPITDASLAAFIKLVRYHESKSPRKGFALNRPGHSQSEFFIGWHSQYHQVACPGEYLFKRLPGVIDELQGKSAPTIPDVPSKPTSPSKPKPVPKRTTYVRAPGGERGAPRWPKGPLMVRLQQALKDRGRYPGWVDGVGGELTAKGIQETLNISQKNGTGRAFVRTPVDGRLGINNAFGVQYYAADFGDYYGPTDGDPLTQSWSNFVLGLERP